MATLPDPNAARIDFDRLFQRTRTTVVISWGLLLYLTVIAAGLLLDGQLLWALYTDLTIAIAILPAAMSRDWMRIPPPGLIAIVALPFTVTAAETGVIAGHTLSYVSAAAVAVLVIAELTMFTAFDTTKRFGIYLVGLTTVAIAGMWAVARWLSDTLLGTRFLVSDVLLMREFAAALLAGIIAGLLFRRVLDRIEHGVGVDAAA
ncbi:MAG: hypothetical protein SVW02_02225 [Candidatus Nanohaloarchaea archaeon]|nr:hypothetical protein [Candidatus Nanohaloarchaea archaeon]